MRCAKGFCGIFNYLFNLPCRKCGVIICSACSDNWKAHRDARLCKDCLVEINASQYLEKKRESVETSKHQSKTMDQKKVEQTSNGERNTDSSGKVVEKDVINSNPSPYATSPSTNSSSSSSSSLSSLPSGRDTVSTIEEPKSTQKSTPTFSRETAENSNTTKVNTNERPETIKIVDAKTSQERPDTIKIVDSPQTSISASLSQPKPSTSESGDPEVLQGRINKIGRAHV